MKTTLQSLISLACASFALAPLTALADVPAATPVAAAATPKAADNVQGKISSIDTAAKTITVTSHHGANTSTFAWDDATKILKTSEGALSDVKVGDTVRAYGAATPEAPTLTASHILIEPAITAGKHKTGPKSGFHRNHVEGVIATTTPTLTLTTPGGVTVTVTTTAETKVESVTAAAPSDLSAGVTVQARLKTAATPPVAATITIVPAHARRTANAK
ncbi:hypothetical protein CCAX7_008460 [Capsulimonas corticalis]|uniref:Uncharacterized protein n=1 Tax=Capsulimonas corticalis TaxID=2219043 RepID=A0A402CU07_9BACT|nr:DUF5666 domain-containing protein [Capsulimonas corticalis]BDI28795.1 hypothetical protein CCAX7_008460 [Capsulimonas corticalis]